MTKKEFYEKVAEKFYSAGLMKKIYESDRYVICNIANASYGVIPIANNNNSALEFMLITGDEAREIINDNDFVDYIYSKRNKKHVYLLNENAFATMKKMEEKVSRVGPYIDSELEEELIRMGQDRTK